MSDKMYRIPHEIQTRTGSPMYLHCEHGHDKRPENPVHEQVLKKLESSLADSYLRLFYQYPNTRDGEGERIDIVALHGAGGVYAISISELTLDEIENVDGPSWHLSNGESRAVLRQARNCEESLKRQFKKRDEVMTEGFNSELRLSVRGFLALPNIDRAAFTSEFELPGSILERILFADDLQSNAAVRERLDIADSSPLSDDLLRHSIAILKFSDLLSGNQLNVVDDPQTRGEIAAAIKSRLKCITDQQFEIGLQLPNSPQRFRGIAGSGKTVVIALRAAFAHYKTDWDICVTFRNHGLYQTHQKLITEFYKAFSGGEAPDWGGSLKLMHGWGNKDRDGLYRSITLANDAQFYTSQAASQQFGIYDPATKLEKVCYKLLNTTDIDQQFDAILIDEGQDLTPSFYQMCREALTDEQRLYWAADEAQNLSTLEARSLEALFGTDADGNIDLAADVRGFVSGGVPGTHVMKRSFRTPRSILMTAHAFGMGLYRDEPVRSITDTEQWDRLGYEVVKGNFRTENVGEQIRIERPSVNSPHPLTQLEEERDGSIYPLLETYWGETERDEANWIAEKIQADLEAGLSLDDIMIVYFWPPSVRDQRIRILFDAINDRTTGIDNINTALNRVEEGDRAEFNQTGKISLSQVHYARGNESPCVYLTGLEYISQSGYEEYMASNSNWHDEYLGARNEAFIGLSRTLAWCRVSGYGKHDSAYNELKHILRDTDSHAPFLKFPVPKKDALTDDIGPMGIQTTLPSEYE